MIKIIIKYSLNDYFEHKRLQTYKCKNQIIV